jgi:hypothetical protein
MKLFHSQPNDELKDRAKSVGKLRKNGVKAHKEDHTERTIQYVTSPPKPKKRKLKEK